MEHAVPVAQILLSERQVESILMTQRVQICRRCSLTQHLRHGIAGHQMDEQEDHRDNEPDNGKRVEETTAQRGQQLHAPPRAGMASVTAEGGAGTGSMRTRLMRCPLISATV